MREGGREGEREEPATPPLYSYHLREYPLTCHRVMRPPIDHSDSSTAALRSTPLFVSHSLDILHVLASQDGYTPLHIATDRGRRAVVQTLIDYGADIYASEKVSCSALALNHSESESDRASDVTSRCLTHLPDISFHRYCSGTTHF